MEWVILKESGLVHMAGGDSLPGKSGGQVKAAISGINPVGPSLIDRE